MKRTRRGYKVLNPNMGSVIINRMDVGYVHYKINTWVYPAEYCGPLCVFKKKKDAKNFWSINILLYKCKYKKSKQRAYRPYMDFENEREYITDHPPTGTIFADKVKITRRILENEKI